MQLSHHPRAVHSEPGAVHYACSVTEAHRRKHAIVSSAANKLSIVAWRKQCGPRIDDVSEVGQNSQIDKISQLSKRTSVKRSASVRDTRFSCIVYISQRYQKVGSGLHIPLRLVPSAVVYWADEMNGPTSSDIYPPPLGQPIPTSRHSSDGDRTAVPTPADSRSLREGSESSAGPSTDNKGKPAATGSGSESDQADESGKHGWSYKNQLLVRCPASTPVET